MIQKKIYENLDIFFFRSLSLGKGSKKKKKLVEFSTKRLTPPPLSGKEIKKRKMIYENLDIFFFRSLSLGKASKIKKTHKLGLFAQPKVGKYPEGV